MTKRAKQQTKQTLAWEVDYITEQGFVCRFRITDPNSDTRALLARAGAIMSYLDRQGFAPVTAGPTAAVGEGSVTATSQPRPLSEGQNRLLVTKLVRTDETRADLYGRGHKYPDLGLFVLSDLADVGIDFEALEIGKEVPCRFFAIWENSKKLNSKGNPYKDICWLEAA